MKGSIKTLLLPAFLVLGALGCSTEYTADTRVNAGGNTIETRYPLPAGFKRQAVIRGSFGHYLPKLPLKAVGSKVHYYDGEIKSKENVYDAVIDLEIGDKNLQQCADAVIRLRAEYLYAKQHYSDIHFNFTSGFNAEYDKWRAGYRVKVDGNKVSWVKSAKPSDDYAGFRKYLDVVFTYAGTLSLSRELKTVALEDMKTGDVFIQGGSPGHAVIVVNMALDTVHNKKYFMLAQSYMPAQEIQVLLNPNVSENTVWYALDKNATEIVTPEWRFTHKDLKRFPADRF